MKLIPEITGPTGTTLDYFHFINSCLDDEYESECPLCAPENRKVLDIIRRQMEDRDMHEQFQSLVSHCTHGLLYQYKLKMFHLT